MFAKLWALGVGDNQGEDHNIKLALGNYTIWYIPPSSTVDFQAGWYWPLGTVSSLTQTSNFLGPGKELRLHNRWMQLSMQAEALLALSEYKCLGANSDLNGR